MGAIVFELSSKSLMKSISSANNSKTEPSLELARNIKSDLQDSLGEKLISFLVFGSVARQEHTPQSDLDILVVCNRIDKQLFEKVKKTLSDYDKTVVIQLATPTPIFSNILAKEPFTLTAITEGEIIYDRWLLKPLKEVTTRSELIPNEYTENFLLNRAQERIKLSYKKMDEVYKHLQASITDCGFAICHYLGEAPIALDDMLSCLKEKRVPNPILEKIEETLSQESNNKEIEKFIKECRDFFSTVEKFINQKSR